MADHHQDENVLRLGIRSDLAQHRRHLRLRGLGALQGFDHPIGAAHAAQNFIRIGGQQREAGFVIRFAAQARDGNEVCGREGRARRQGGRKSEQSESQTTPHLRRSSHSPPRIKSTSRNRIGMSQMSRLSCAVMPASETAISEGRRFDFAGV